MVVGPASLYLSRRLLGLPNFRGTLSTRKRGLLLRRYRLASIHERVLPCLWLRMPMAKLLRDLLCSLHRACSAAHHSALVKLLTVLILLLLLLPTLHLLWHISFLVHLLSPTVSLQIILHRVELASLHRLYRVKGRRLLLKRVR